MFKKRKCAAFYVYPDQRALPPSADQGFPRPSARKLCARAAKPGRFLFFVPRRAKAQRQKQQSCWVWQGPPCSVWHFSDATVPLPSALMSNPRACSAPYCRLVMYTLGPNRRDWVWYTAAGNSWRRDRPGFFPPAAGPAARTSGWSAWAASATTPLSTPVSMSGGAATLLSFPASHSTRLARRE